jgi:hypothetical protein
MKATRRTQPYRGSVHRPQGPALAAMLRGGPAYLPNPQNAHRRMKRAHHKHLSKLLSARGSNLSR